mmetsp:Transcript_16074/g.34889  ORF Transcript_16074/g.34889 Transcript_16074/m.34889 type:complete len:210 (-) Transcript_16074:402-1031(-)
MLTPKWEALAGKLKHSVKVAYWDTEQGGAPPPLLGQIKGTPTLRAFVPQRKSAHNAKRAVDYDRAREVGDMGKFALGLMPDYVERIDGGGALDALLKKGSEWGIPVVLLFSDTSGTSSMLKALAAEYRRRALIGEVKSKKYEAAVNEYQVTSFPTLVGLRTGQEPLRFEKKKPSHFNLDLFISKVALGKPVKTKPRERSPSDAGDKEEL